MTDPNIEPIKERIARLRKRLDDLEWVEGDEDVLDMFDEGLKDRLRREIAHLEADRRAGVEFIPKF